MGDEDCSNGKENFLVNIIAVVFSNLDMGALTTVKEHFLRTKLD